MHGDGKNWGQEENLSHVFFIVDVFSGDHARLFVHRTMHKCSHSMQRNIWSSLSWQLLFFIFFFIKLQGVVKNNYCTMTLNFQVTRRIHKAKGCAGPVK